MLTKAQQIQRDLSWSAKNSATVHDTDFGVFANIDVAAPHIIDVGANRGQSIVSFKTVCPQCTLVSFEANPLFFPVLAEVSTWFSDVRVENYGLGESSGTLKFHIPVVDGVPYLEEGSLRPDNFDQPWVQERLRSYGADLTFDCISVDIVTAGEALATAEPDVIKIDVEGAEYDVLRSLASLVERCRPIFLIENSDYFNVHAFLCARGYLCLEYDAQENRLAPLSGPRANSLYLHPEAARGLQSILASPADSGEAGAGAGYSEKADFAEHRANIAAMLENLAATSPGNRSRVLDIGGGQGMHACFLAATFDEVWCTDVIDYDSLYDGEFRRLFWEKCERNAVHYEEQRLHFQRSDAMALDFPDGFFDLVTSFNAFEHIPDPERALQEIIRVLAPEGVAYISFDPIWTADSGNHFAHYVPEPWAHLLLPTEEFVARMRAAGAGESEIAEFPGAMNQRRLPYYREMFRVAAGRSDVEVLQEVSWEGFVRHTHKLHANYKAALQRGYGKEELCTRGMRVILRKNPVGNPA